MVVICSELLSMTWTAVSTTLVPYFWPLWIPFEAIMTTR